MTLWRYVIGCFASGRTHVALVDYPIGSFSTGQHGPAGRHRRETGARYSVRQAFADAAARR